MPVPKLSDYFSLSSLTFVSVGEARLYLFIKGYFIEGSVLLLMF